MFFLFDRNLFRVNIFFVILLLNAVKFKFTQFLFVFSSSFRDSSYTDQGAGDDGSDSNIEHVFEGFITAYKIVSFWVACAEILTDFEFCLRNQS